MSTKSIVSGALKAAERTSKSVRDRLAEPTQAPAKVSKTEAEAANFLWKCVARNTKRTSDLIVQMVANQKIPGNFSGNFDPVRLNLRGEAVKEVCALIPILQRELHELRTHLQPEHELRVAWEAEQARLEE